MQAYVNHAIIAGESRLDRAIGGARNLGVTDHSRQTQADTISVFVSNVGHAVPFGRVMSTARRHGLPERRQAVARGLFLVEEPARQETSNQPGMANGAVTEAGAAWGADLDVAGGDSRVAA